MEHHPLSELGSKCVISLHVQPPLERIHLMLGTGEADAKALLKRIKIISPAKRPVSVQFLEAVGEALLKRRRLHIQCLTRARGVIRERDVSPQRLVHNKNTSYLNARCRSRERLLRFALDAIDGCDALKTRANEVPLEQLEAGMDGHCRIYAGAHSHWATLVFQAWGAQWQGMAPGQAGKWLGDSRYGLAVQYFSDTETSWTSCGMGNTFRRFARRGAQARRSQAVQRRSLIQSERSESRQGRQQECHESSTT